jgi:hypothetical protein
MEVIRYSPPNADIVGHGNGNGHGLNAKCEREKAEADEQDGKSLAGKAEQVAGAHLKVL